MLVEKSKHVVPPDGGPDVAERVSILDRFTMTRVDVHLEFLPALLHVGCHIRSPLHDCNRHRVQLSRLELLARVILKVEVCYGEPSLLSPNTDSFAPLTCKLAVNARASAIQRRGGMLWSRATYGRACDWRPSW